MKLDKKGQAFFEFILMFAILTILSFTMMRVVGTQVSRRWENLGNKIIGPTSNPNNHPRVELIRMR